jgi:unsaturated rhamnogalacturonyl hydrolase
MGYLPASRISIAEKGYAGMLRQFIKTENGQTNLYGTVKVSGLGGNPYRDGSFNYYMSEPVIVNDPKGVGAFILASNEIEMLPTLKIGGGRKVVMDNFFNRETKTDAFGNTVVTHYKWWEKDNGGFSMWGHIFSKNGFKITELDEAPTDANLKGASAYLLVDPDFPKENKKPNYIDRKDIDALVRFVNGGGTLILMSNDSNNVEFENFNVLAGKFGIHFNENLKHDVVGNKFEMGEFPVAAGHPIFKTARTLFIKQVCTQELKKPAVSVYTDPEGVIMSAARVGKGFVFAVSDPWFYNEYVDGRKLPAKYENYKAAEDLVRWIAKPQVPAASTK